MVHEVSVREAKTHLSRLLKQVEDGERIVISRRGTPVADLVPHTQTRHARPPLVPGLLKGQLAYNSETFDGVDPELVQAMTQERGDS